MIAANEATTGNYPQTGGYAANPNTIQKRGGLSMRGILGSPGVRDRVQSKISVKDSKPRRNYRIDRSIPDSPVMKENIHRIKVNNTNVSPMTSIRSPESSLSGFGGSFRVVDSTQNISKFEETLSTPTNATSLSKIDTKTQKDGSTSVIGSDAPTNNITQSTVTSPPFGKFVSST